MMKTVSAIAAVLVAICSFGLASARAAGLRIATEGALAPWNFTAADGRLVGFEVDLGEDLCRRADLECEFVPQDWNGILPGLQQGLYDAVMGGVSITSERAQRVDFSAAYAADPATFALRTGSALRAMLPAVDRVDLAAMRSADKAAVAEMGKALAGHTVAVQVSTIHARMMEVLFPTVAVRVYDRIDDAAHDLVAGRVDFLLSARSAVNAVAESGRGVIEPAGPSFQGGVLGNGVGIAFPKGSQIVHRFNAAIAEAEQDGTIAMLSTHWFGFDASVHR